MKYAIVVRATAVRMMERLGDARIRDLFERRIDRLAEEPEKQGKPLTDDLSGLRSVRVAGGRYRIIYQIDVSGVVVIVGAVGIRREGSRSDVYREASRLRRQGLL